MPGYYICEKCGSPVTEGLEQKNGKGELFCPVCFVEDEL